MTRTVTIPPGLTGDLTIPPQAKAIVLFAHGSGSSRLSPRNRYVAQALQNAGLATLLIDLLTPEEERLDRATAHLRFDIGLLAERLLDTTDWLHSAAETHSLRIGYFGASTGAGAALVAAASRLELIGAVVSRGGRPDLAGDALTRVKAPVLLIVGGNDDIVIEINQNAFTQLSGDKKLEIIPRAGHLFEEPGTLEQVADLAANWFTSHLA
jgi:dienelactone hydrolase